MRRYTIVPCHDADGQLDIEPMPDEQGEWVLWHDHKQAVAEARFKRGAELLEAWPEEQFWRPAPEQCPADGAYWYKHEDGASVFILRDGVVLGTEWPRRWNVFYQDEYPLQIAGPLRPPEGDK